MSGIPTLVPHRLHGDVVMDGRVRLRIPGHPDPRERVAQTREVLEQVEGTGIVARGCDRVARRDEHFVDTHAGQPLDDVAQLGATRDHPSREVRYDRVPVAEKAFGQVYGGGEGLRR